MREVGVCGPAVREGGQAGRRAERAGGREAAEQQRRMGGSGERDGKRREARHAPSPPGQSASS